MNEELPISEQTARDIVIPYLRKNFGDKVRKAVAGTPFDENHIYGIACQEMAIYWLPWIKTHTPDQILSLCIGDATGDTQSTTGMRKAFPTNYYDFAGKAGKQVADMLVDEGKKYRVAKGFHDMPPTMLYKAYGIFQYDLQAYFDDKDFFDKKLWYNFDECLKRVIKELISKYHIHNDPFAAVKAYNGIGQAAENYAKNVFLYKNLC